VTAAVAHGLLTVTGTVTSTRSLRYAGNRLDPSHASLDPATRHRDSGCQSELENLVYVYSNSKMLALAATRELEVFV
jgi:hypothetical protein